MTPTMTFELQLILSFLTGAVIALCICGWIYIIRGLVRWLKRKVTKKKDNPIQDEKLNN